MDEFTISKSKLQGEIWIPPSKSHTMRALFFASLAKGKSEIHHYLKSPDTDAMISALRKFGIKIEVKEEKITVWGSKLAPASDVIDCGNSGQVLRFVTALSALLPTYTVLTGDESIRTNRPMAPLIKALQELGCFCESSKRDGYAPILVRGPLSEGVCSLRGEDSQPVSSLLMMGAFSPHPIEIHVESPGETPWIDLTLSWLHKFSIPYEKKGYEYFKVMGQACICGFEYYVPGDFSTAAFPIAAAIVTKSEITLQNIDFSDVQGDKKLISILEERGVHFEKNEKSKTLKVLASGSFDGGEVDINSCIDALPILAVIGCFGKNPLSITNGKIAREKESDRIHAICMELKKMGARIKEREDGLQVWPSSLRGASLLGHQDHRIAMSLAVASMGAFGESQMQGGSCIQKTYPTFIQSFSLLGAQIQ